MPTWISNLIMLIISAICALLASVFYGESFSSPKKSDSDPHPIVLSDKVPTMKFNPESIHFGMSTADVKTGYVSDPEDHITAQVAKYSDSLKNIRSQLEDSSGFDPNVNSKEFVKLGNGYYAGPTILDASAYGMSDQLDNGEFAVDSSAYGLEDADDFFESSKTGSGRKEYIRIIESAKRYDAFAKLKSKDSEVFIFPSGKHDPSKLKLGFLIKGGVKQANGEYPPRPADKTEYTKLITVHKCFVVSKFSDFYNPDNVAKLTASGIDKLKTAADQKKFLEDKFKELKALHSDWTESDMRNFAFVVASPSDTK